PTRQHSGGTLAMNRHALQRRLHLGAACALAALAAHSPASADESTSVSLRIEISSLRNNTGQVAVALYNNEDDFPEQGRELVGRVVGIKDKRVELRFENLKPGRYAVAVLHDENRNNKMDFNWVGMPTEGYGFSRDAK